MTKKDNLLNLTCLTNMLTKCRSPGSESLALIILRNLLELDHILYSRGHLYIAKKLCICFSERCGCTIEEFKSHQHPEAITILHSFRCIYFKILKILITNRRHCNIYNCCKVTNLLESKELLGSSSFLIRKTLITSLVSRIYEYYS